MEQVFFQDQSQLPLKQSGTVRYSQKQRNSSLDDFQIKKLLTQVHDMPGDHKDPKDSSREGDLSKEQRQKLKILEKFGFRRESNTVKATLQNLHPTQAFDRYRTQCFRSENERVASYRKRIEENMTPSEHDSDRLKNYTGEELQRPFYKELEPQIPYPHKSKKVTAQGFVRDQPEFIDRILSRFKKWHEKRYEIGVASLKAIEDDRASNFYDEMLSRTESPVKINSPEPQYEKSGSSQQAHRRIQFPTQISLNNSISRISRQKSLGKTTKPIRHQTKMSLLQLETQPMSHEPLSAIRAGSFKDTFFFQQMRNRGQTVISENLNASKSKLPRMSGSHLKEGLKPNTDPFRLTIQAAYYDFAHRPFEEKARKGKKERDELRRKEKGVRGDPKKSEDRFINKIFDHGRIKQKDKGGTEGCDIDYHVRSKITRVGVVPTGGLNMLRGGVALESQKQLNLDPNSAREMVIRENLLNRGRTDSAFEGDNHFYNLSKPRKDRKNFSELLQYEEEGIKHTSPEQPSFSTSPKKHYFQRMTQVQKGEVKPVLASMENFNAGSKLLNFSQREAAVKSDYMDKQLDKSSLIEGMTYQALPSLGASEPNEIEDINERHIRFMSEVKQNSVSGAEDSFFECETPEKLAQVNMLSSRNPKLYAKPIGNKRTKKARKGSIESFTEQTSKSQRLNINPVHHSVVIRDSSSALNKDYIAEGTTTGTQFHQSESSKKNAIRTSRDGFFKAGIKIMDEGKPNHSKIKHGSYFVSVQEPTLYSSKAVYPQSFPQRHSINFVQLNKSRKQTHVYEQSSESQITLASETLKRLQSMHQSPEKPS